ncbi:MAG TPA: TIGR03086 family metal-binding protein [Acidimicrobiales bacterium]
MIPPVIEARQALTIANDGFEQRLRAVRPEDWGRATLCTEWDVRALVNHVVGGGVRYTMLLHGATPEEVEATRALDHLGDEPVASFITTAEQVEAAFAEEGALERTVRHRTGERTGRELLGMRVVDVAVHGWDLAVAIGGDETIAPDTVEFLLYLSPDLEGGRRAGAFAQPVGESPIGASLQGRLLHMVGRDAAAAGRAS